MKASTRQSRPSPRTWRRVPASVLTLAVALTIVGCAGQQPTDTPATKAAGEQMRIIREQCEERRRSGEFKNVSEVERCANPRVTTAYQQAGYPYMDLIRFAAAARLAGADKVDKGEIKESDYAHERLILRDRLAAEINRRNDHSANSPPTAYPDTLDPTTTNRLVEGLTAFSALRR